MMPFVGHTQAVRCVAFTPDGGTLVSGGDDGKIIVWDRDTARPRFKIRSGFKNVHSVACHPDGERILAAFRYPRAVLDSHDRLRFWGVATGKPCVALDDNRGLWHRAELLASGPVVQEIVVPPCDAVRDIHFRPDGNSFACVNFGRSPHHPPVGRAELWRLDPSPSPVASWLDRRTRVTAFALAADGDTAAVATHEYVRVGRLDAAKVPPGYAARGPVSSIALSPNGSKLAGT